MVPPGRVAQTASTTGFVAWGVVSTQTSTPAPFVSACDKFIYTEVLRAKIDESERIVRMPAGKLKQAARACFAERGYAATQVGDLARRAGVAHGTFYVHCLVVPSLDEAPAPGLVR